MERILWSSAFGAVSTFAIVWLTQLIKELHSIAAHSLREYIVGLFAGAMTLIFGLIGFVFRLFGVQSSELNSYPSPIWLWCGISILTGLTFYFVPDSKLILRLLLLEMIIAIFVVFAAPMLALLLKN